MDADATGRVPPRVARARLVTDPGARADVVEVARRHGDADLVRDVAVTVGPERGGVERQPRLPALVRVTATAYELLDLDDDVVAAAKAARRHRDRDRRRPLLLERDARLRPVSPRPDRGVHAERKRGPQREQAAVDRPALGT